MLPSLADIALLTGGGDKPYALGLADSLTAKGVQVDFIGSDDLDVPEVRDNARIRFLNLRGDQSLAAPLWRKVSRMAAYYLRLIAYAASAHPRVFHILWNNKLEVLDRTALMLYYRLCGRTVVLTVHNVNVKKRDGRDSVINRLTLRAQYRLAAHLFVHTDAMRDELCRDFGVSPAKVSVIPFGLNSTVPDTALTRDAARQRLGLDPTDRAMLFFGNIAPYKGVEYLIEAVADVRATVPGCRLVIAGRPKGEASYWDAVCARIKALDLERSLIRRIEYIPDADTEVYFKACDVLVLPYTHVFQSGVLFLGYNFGLPVIAADIASLKDDIIEGVTGYVCRPRAPQDLARAIARYFSSDLYRNLATHRAAIREFALARHSWEIVAERSVEVYGRLGCRFAARSTLPQSIRSTL